MRIIVCLVLSAAVCGWSSITPAVQPRSGCENVRGTVVAQITGTSTACPFGTIEGDVFDEAGSLIGTTAACISDLAPRGNGAFHADITHLYSIGNLNFSTEDQGVLNEIAPNLFRFENRLTIVDGATGFLRAHGLVNTDSGEINLTFNGRICVE
jgi:hypothetical protein